MIGLVERAMEEEASYVEFMLHSSELMPGGSRRFPTKRSIERLYDHLERLFAKTAARFRGSTLAQFRQEIVDRGQTPGVSGEKPRTYVSSGIAFGKRVEQKGTKTTKR